MKSLILIALLTFFTGANKAQAQFKLEITPSDSKYAKMSIDCQDEAKCDKKLLKWIDKQRFFKGTFSSDPIGSIVTKQEIDIEGESTDLYFKPDNFSVSLVDMSAEIAEKEAKKLAKQVLKDKLNKEKKDLSLKEINELLRD